MQKNIYAKQYAKLAKMYASASSRQRDYLFSYYLPCGGWGTTTAFEGGSFFFPRCGCRGGF